MYPTRIYVLFIYFIIVVYYIITFVKLCYVCVDITSGLRNCRVAREECRIFKSYGTKCCF